MPLPSASMNSGSGAGMTWVVMVVLGCSNSSSRHARLDLASTRWHHSRLAPPTAQMSKPAHR